VAPTKWSHTHDYTPTPVPDVPAGASTVDDWADLNTSTPTRYFEAAHAHVPVAHGDVVQIFIAGFQHADSTVTPQVVVHQLHSDDPITSTQARHIARALMNAADVIDRRTDNDEG
jgi:hypothetical protein